MFAINLVFILRESVRYSLRPFSRRNVNSRTVMQIIHNYKANVYVYIRSHCDHTGIGWGQHFQGQGQWSSRPRPRFLVLELSSLTSWPHPCDHNTRVRVRWCHGPVTAGSYCVCSTACAIATSSCTASSVSQMSRRSRGNHRLQVCWSSSTAGNIDQSVRYFDQPTGLVIILPFSVWYGAVEEFFWYCLQET